MMGGCVWKIIQLLYADDTLLNGNSRENIQQLLNEIDNVCKRRKLTVNAFKSKGMVCGKSRPPYSRPVWRRLIVEHEKMVG